ncbi:TetR/AcrR family transcriptional regulator [Actinocorallia populi]|uniref:TetR/AcrR family transcriptional regulator n=1 Tax=Actinocorallia populi TaxID=2079200 RepID=UPI000D096F6F|nr:TetR/AcrR family transcriptional regulator [Actinocorallia populi]
MSDSGRDAILRAARRAFALRPYAAVTLRGIAAEAGVSAALIVKHFGGKEQLFDAVADFGPDVDLLLSVPRERLGRHLVETALVTRRTGAPPPLLRVIFGIAAGDERALLAERFREQATARLAALLEGRDARLRAELVVAQFLGLSTVLVIHRDGAAAAADVARVAELYAPGVQRLIDGGADGDG